MPETNGDIQLPFDGVVPVENAGSSLDNFAAETDDQIYAKELARAFVDTGETPAGLLIVGAPGSGKSHLAVGIARRHAELGGRAAFVSFKGSGLDFGHIPDAPSSMGWWGHADQLPAVYDLVVIDDMPGSMPSGPRHQLQELVLASYNRGTKLVITSNQPVDSVVQQIAETPEGHPLLPDKAVAVSERMAQVWQTVEFDGTSHRSDQPKWWRSVRRPPTMPRRLDEVAVQIRDSGNFPVLLGAVMLRIAEAAGADGTEIDELRDLIEREQERRSGR